MASTPTAAPHAASTVLVARRVVRFWQRHPFRAALVAVLVLGLLRIGPPWLGPADPALPATDAVGRWPLDEGSGTVANDVTGNGHDGTLLNDPTWGPGVSGTALDFDGRSREAVEIPDDPGGALDRGTGDFAVEAWFRAIDGPDDDSTDALISKVDYQSDPIDGYELTWYSDGVSQELSFRLWDDAPITMSTGVWEATASADEWHDGQWRHVVGQVSGSTLELWIDGELVASAPHAAGNVDADTALRFGVDVLGNQDLEEELDELALYDRALTPSEIARGAGVAQVAVNSTGDAGDVTPGDDVCDTGGTNSEGDPECTLRAAIEEANASTVVELIDFAIPASDPNEAGGVWTIAPGSQYPALTSPVEIDARTQSGYTSTPVVELDGVGVGAAGASGLRIDADAVTVAGLAIGGFDGSGVQVLADGTDARLLANHVGVDPSGTLGRPNGSGITLLPGSSRTSIGGSGTDRNVISGNDADGIRVDGSDANEIAGNHIGTDATGLAAVPNGGAGVSITGTTVGNVVGQRLRGNVVSGNGGNGIQISGDATGSLVRRNLVGVGVDGDTVVSNGAHGVVLRDGPANTEVGDSVVPDAGNVVSGNVQGGVLVDGNGNGATADNVVVGNTIGMNLARTAVRGNGGAGVRVRGGASDTAVGGTSADASNLVVGNDGDGVVVEDAATTRTSVLNNELRGNTGLGINLLGGTEDGDGVTANDAEDADTGPNDLLNAPALVAPVTGASSLDVRLDVPAGDYRVEVFTNPTAGADPSGHGEGETLVHAETVTATGAAGDESFTLTGTPAWSSGDVVTATATQEIGGGIHDATSEFSAAVTAAASTTVVVNTVGDQGDATPGDGLCDTGGTNSEGDPACSLRAAIQEANAGPVTEVRFAIPTSSAGHDAGAGTWTIAPAAVLPDMTGVAVLDGSSQPGWSTTPVIVLDAAGIGAGEHALSATAGAPTITALSVVNAPARGIDVDGTAVTLTDSHLGLLPDGTAAGNGAQGLLVTGGDGSAITDNVVGDNGSSGIDVSATDDVLVARNTVGLAPDGDTVRPNLSGIRVDESTNVVVGGAEGDGNVVAGNVRDGVAVAGASADVVVGHNLVGVDATGLLDRGNGEEGLLVGGTRVTVTDNVVAGNGFDNVGLYVTLSSSTISRNLIGVGADGVTPIGGDRAGIRVNDGSSDVLVGGTATDDGNVVAHHARDGIVVAGASTSTISVLGNRVFDNGGLAVDLEDPADAPDGVTANDAGDADTGPNGLLNTPTIVTAAEDGVGGTAVAAELDVAAGTYLVEWFANPGGADPTGFGEARLPVTQQEVSHPGGTASYATTLPITGRAPLTAALTACDGAGCADPGASSELSAAVAPDPAAGAAVRPLRDSSANRQDARTIGGMDAAAVVGGRVGDALDLDGVDDQVLLDNLDLQGSAVTISAWVRTDAPAEDARVVTREYGDLPGDREATLSFADSTSIEADVARTGTTASGPAPAVGTWSLVALTYDGTSLRVHRDGVEVSSRAVTGSFTPDPTLLTRIGGAPQPGPAGDSRQLDGRVDEVRVLRTARSPDWLAAEAATQTAGGVVEVGTTQARTPGPWSVTTGTGRGGSQAAEAPDQSPGAWLVANGLDEPGLELDAWWRVSTTAGVQLGQGVRSVVEPLLPVQDESALIGGSGWDLGQSVTGGARDQLVAPPGGQTPTAGAWHRVVVRIDQLGEFVVEVDGVEVARDAGAGLRSSGSAAFRIGALPAGEDWWLDDVRARRYVTPEPTVSVGPPEPQP